ncbi:hypothetical protein N658DRAFT_291395 [Parathielavia hyrcaniae]|uniref:Uncharacterized protein n=1 Tax=Parathielavia hyrcaniae TaxID=113614 RepID=A0AAN6SYF3_9PEZI|nr:hypothetical protein N658DRAFT_291395 [Parathielavia hyrcaniae]
MGRATHVRTSHLSFLSILGPVAAQRHVKSPYSYCVQSTGADGRRGWPAHPSAVRSSLQHQGVFSASLVQPQAPIFVCIWLFLAHSQIPVQAQSTQPHRVLVHKLPSPSRASGTCLVQYLGHLSQRQHPAHPPPPRAQRCYNLGTLPSPGCPCTCAVPYNALAPLTLVPTPLHVPYLASALLSLPGKRPLHPWPPRY